MLNPGDYPLYDGSATPSLAFTITTAGTQVGGVVLGLDGIISLLAQLRFIYGSGGTNVKCYLQTSLDQGSTWIDIACVVFTTANAHKVFNINGQTQKAAFTPSDAGLTDNTELEGVLGDRFRLKLVSTGTYAGSTQVLGFIHAK